MFKSVVSRFLKGVAAGAVASMGLVTVVQPAVWSDFPALLSSLGLACAYGALTGFLLALHKWVNWDEDSYL